MKDLTKKIKKLRNLPQYKDKTEEEINKIAQEQVEQEEIINSLTFAINDEERDFAKNLLDNYLAQSSFENFSEKQILGQLIDQELLAKRIKENLKTEYGKANPAIPLQYVEQLDAIVDRIEQLQEKLGLTRKDGEQNNALSEWEKLKKKALAYYKESAGCNVTRCPYCQKLYSIQKDMRGFHTEKLPLFKKTIIYNKEMFSWYEKGIITKEQLANALGTTVDYIDYIFETVYKNEDKNA